MRSLPRCLPLLITWGMTIANSYDINMSLK